LIGCAWVWWVPTSFEFCSKERLSGSLSCGTAKHKTSKFTVLPNHCYIKFNEIQTYCSPALYVEGYTPSQIQALSSRSYTMNEWGAVFADLTSRNFPEWFPMTPVAASLQVDTTRLALQPLSILSPTAGAGNLFDFQPLLSFDSSNSSVLSPDAENRRLWRTQVVPPELLSHVDFLHPT
jgi:hypothetical protein